ncbi:MAG: EamA family transporter [bacterium]
MIEFLSPNLLALIAALSFAMAHVFYRDALGRMSVVAATATVNATLCAGAVLIYLGSAGAPRWAPMGVALFALVGVLGSFLGRYLNYLSITFIGLARTHVLGQTMPVWSAAAAVLLLGERLRPGVVLGTLGILAGALLLIQERKIGKKKVPILYYAVALLGPLSLAWTPTIRKIAFSHLPSVPLGIAIAMGVGVVLNLGTWPLVEEKRARTWTWSGVVRTMAGGLLNLVAAVSFWSAIKEGEVISVVPITRLSGLFVLAFSWIFFRKQERITWRVVIGALIAVAGAAAIARSG